jgi:hypothetical protein
MSASLKFFTILYLILLSAVVGASLYAGAVVAPVTFNTTKIFGVEVLSRFQEGLIMTENFVRLSYLVTLTALFVLLYESYRFAKIYRDPGSVVAALMVIVPALLFSFYFVPEIVTMQQLGEAVTREAEFRGIHQASEVNFKLFVLAALFLLVRNLQALLR